MTATVSSPEAERCLLGCLWLRPELAPELGAVVTSSDFADEAHRLLFDRTMVMLAEQRFDATLLLEELRQSGDLDRIGGIGRIGQIVESVTHVAHATYYANVVRERSQRRQLAELASGLLSAAQGTEPVEGLIADADKALHRIEQQGAALPLHTAAESARATIEQVLTARRERTGLGIATGLADFDRQTGGLFPGELIVLAGRPGNGKTSLAMQMARHVAEQAHRVLFVSLEMAHAELALRSIAGDAGVSVVNVRDGSISEQAVDALVEAANALSRLPLHTLDAPRCSVADIRRAASQLARQHKDLALVAVDYLGLVAPSDTRVPRHEQVAAITRDLKHLARDLSLPVLALAQLNRESEAGKGSRPKLSNLRESGSIEQDADVVLFVHRPELQNPDDPDLRSVAELIIAKNRNGPTPTIELYFDRDRTRFRRLERYREFDGTPREEF